MENILDYIRKHHVWVSVIAYAFLAILLTYPLIANFSSAIPEGGRDSFLVMGQIERKSAIISENGWKEGMRMIIDSREYNSFLPYILADQIFHNKFVTNNFFFLLSFLLSGLGAYLLTFHLTKNKSVSFLAGIIFSFSSFHVYQSTAIHVGMRHQELIPLFALFLIRFFEKFEFRFFGLMGLFAILIAVTEHQLLAFTALFAVFFVLYKIITDRSILFNKKFWAFLIVSVLFLAIAAVTLFGNLLKIALSENNFLDPGMKSAINLSIIPSDVLLPPVFHGLWPTANEFAQKSVFHVSRKGDSYYAGIVVIAVVLFFIFQYFKEKLQKNESLVKIASRNRFVPFWLTETLLFFVISMGPAAKIGKETLYLPYYLIYRYIPFYMNIRTVGRFFVFVVLGLSVLFAFAVDYLTKKYPAGKKIIYVSLGLLLLIDFCIMPLKTDPLSYSPFYDGIGKDSQSYKLLEIPGSTNDVFFNYEWITRNVHRKELVNGMTMAREIEGQFEFQKKTPVIKQLLYTIPKGGNPKKKVKNPKEYYKDANKILNQNNIAYITISKKYTEQSIQLNAEKFIEKYIQFDDKYEDEYLIAYKVSRVAPEISQ